MDVEIRRAIATDWSAVGLIHERSAVHEIHFADEAHRPRMAVLGRAFGGELWVAASGAQILGFAACVGADISWLYVDPPFFRQGVGRALLRHAIDNCGAIASATVLSDNVACLSLMASEDFVISAREMVTIPGHGETRVHRVRRIELHNAAAQRKALA
jgi:GNAT superfamily N-acetyltransferase